MSNTPAKPNDSAISAWHEPAATTGAALERAQTNRTLERANRRHETNKMALIDTTEEAKIASDGAAYLGLHSLRRQVDLINEGNDQVRAQEYAADQEMIDDIVKQTVRIHNKAQQRILHTAVTELCEVVDRNLIVEDTRTNVQRWRDKAWSVLTDGLDEG